MIKSFQHKGLEKFYKTGSKAGIQPEHAEKLRDRLLVLDNAEGPDDVALPGWNLHPLKADLEYHWAIKVDRMWRLTFAFEGTDVILLDYQDYH
ncbi:MAG: type II toxin-antitoxin system RelE/ParE family toxin [Acidobacteriaceae bacterium]